jgi:hypothetical protein
MCDVSNAGSSQTELSFCNNRTWRRHFFICVINVRSIGNTHLVEELHDLHSSTSVIRIIKSRRMRWAGHVARMGERRNAYRLFVGKPGGKRPL